jgi:hypothetical protein
MLTPVLKSGRESVCEQLFDQGYIDMVRTTRIAVNHGEW